MVNCNAMYRLEVRVADTAVGRSRSGDDAGRVGAAFGFVSVSVTGDRDGNICE